MAPLYDPQYISRYYDLYADREWQRFEVDVAGRMNFLTHRRLLEEYVRPGTSVLDVGAGPGRFSIELAHLGARVTVGDISPGQLALHREKTEEAGVEESIVGRHVVDIVDLSTFATDSFDAVVCYGGPLSYVMERADTAVGELLRVTRPGGHLLVSVMSLPGATRRFLEGVFELGRQYGREIVDEVVRTGDQHGVVAGPRGHICHMYRWRELKDLLERHGASVVDASASNFLSVAADGAEWLESVVDNGELWDAFVQWELEMCREPGALDGGTHIIAVARKGAAPR